MPSIVYPMLSRDEIPNIQHNPALGDDLKDSTDELYQIYQETPYEKDAIYKAHSKLDAAMREVKMAKYDKGGPGDASRPSSRAEFVLESSQVCLSQVYEVIVNRHCSTAIPL